MHEAGIARAIADTLRVEGLLGVPVRVLVTGGHDEPAAFDAALLFHLELTAEVDTSLVTVVHLPSERWCVSCGQRFEAVGDIECPACGGVTMGSQLDERIEIERADGPGSSAPGPGSSDPSDGADRPSGTGSGGVHDMTMDLAASAGQHGTGHRRPGEHVLERPDDRAP